VLAPAPAGAVDRLASSALGAEEAVETVRDMLRARLLPARRGEGAHEDASAAGNLPDQQPAEARRRFSVPP